MKRIIYAVLLASYLIGNNSCTPEPLEKDETYYSKRKAEGVKMIHVFKNDSVWTQKVGTGKTAILLLHGGPGATHEYFENFPEHIDTSKYSFIFYDQLGSFFSDIPTSKEIWEPERLVKEVELVRKAYNLTDFYLVGHSWGGVLAILYASKYQNHLKGLIVTNTPLTKDGAFEYRKILWDKLEKKMKTEMGRSPSNQELESKYKRIHRYGLDAVPEPMLRFESHYSTDDRRMRLLENVFDDLTEKAKGIKVNTLIIGGEYDFVDPNDFRLINSSIENSELVIIPKAPHFPMWSHTESYFTAIDNYLKFHRDN